MAFLSLMEAFTCQLELLNLLYACVRLCVFVHTFAAGVVLRLQQIKIRSMHQVEVLGLGVQFCIEPKVTSHDNLHQPAPSSAVTFSQLAAKSRAAV